MIHTHIQQPPRCMFPRHITRYTLTNYTKIRTQAHTYHSPLGACFCGTLFRGTGFLGVVSRGGSGWSNKGTLQSVPGGSSSTVATPLGYVAVATRCRARVRSASRSIRRCDVYLVVCICVGMCMCVCMCVCVRVCLYRAVYV
jgi:hypothetical protein